MTTTLTCKHCGRTFETQAKASTRCPGCRAGVRIPKAQQPGNTALPQVRAPVVDRRPVAPVMAVARAIGTGTVAVAPKPDRTDTGQEKPPQAGTLEQAIAAAVMRAHNGTPQAMTAPAVIVQQADRILKGTESAFPHIRHRVEPVSMEMLKITVWIDQGRYDSALDRIGSDRAVKSDQPLKDVLQDSDDTLIGSAVNVVRKARERLRSPRHQRLHSCEWPGCRAVPGINTPCLYRVDSPALDREKLLCAKHAAQETSVPGTVLAAL